MASREWYFLCAVFVLCENDKMIVQYFCVVFRSRSQSQNRYFLKSDWVGMRGGGGGLLPYFVILGGL